MLLGFITRKDDDLGGIAGASFEESANERFSERSRSPRN
jgi:hypothetical protein